MSDKFYRGVKLVWLSEEAHPYHALHWNDDPRSHPWCEACRVRKPPSGIFHGAFDQCPDDVAKENREERAPVTEQECQYWYWAGMAHKHHVGTDGTCYTKHHPLCPHCNPQILEGDVKPWENVESIVPTATEPARTTTATSAGPAEVPVGKAAV